MSEKNIDELQKSLYSRNTPDIRTRRKLRFGNKTYDVNNDWKHENLDEEETKLNDHYEDKRWSFATKFLIFSAIFCVIAVGIGAFIFSKGSNFISADNIDIIVEGPVSVPGGMPVDFNIKVKNKNSVDLELVDLTIEYPSGTTDSVDLTKELDSTREMLGDVKAGDTIEKKVKATIFGEENSEKKINVKVTYNIKNSNSQFAKETTYSLLINSSPISLSTNSFGEVTSGQEFDLKIDISSNSNNVLKNLIATVSYPFGFTYLSSNINPLPDKMTWKLGDLPPQSKRQIVIHGKVTGSDKDERVFNIRVGSQGSQNQNIIGTEFASTQTKLSISKPFMDIKIAIDQNQNSQYGVGAFNRTKNVEISWANNLPTAINNANIIVKLDGNAYDKSSVVPDVGYYRSLTNEIIWDTKTNPEFLSIGSGEEGKIKFSITPTDFSNQSRLVTNPKIVVTVSAFGNRTQESNVPTSLVSAVTKEIRVSAIPNLTGRVLRDVGPFANTGPIPPRAEKITTYTILWSVDSTNNSLSNVTVSSTLPPYVKWLNKVSPDNEDIQYSSTTGALQWNVGSVSAFSQASQRTRQVAFQIAFEPSVTQVGNSQILLDDSIMNGVDDFTGENLSSKINFLTTVFNTDPSYKDTMGAVEP